MYRSGLLNKYLILLTFGLVAFVPIQNVLAKTSITIATFSPVSGADVQDGSLVSNTETGYLLSQTEYDEKLYGVVVLDAAVVLNQASEAGSFPVANTGDVKVRVSNVGGDIRRGDYITSSTIAGVGMKASHSGHVVGVALEDLVLNDPSGRGSILVSLRSQNYIAPATLITNIQELTRLSTSAAQQQPLNVIRYLLAGGIILGCVLISFLHFGRITASSVQALGRNPLARKSIELGIFFNLIMAALLLGSGLVIAILILRY
jgi:F0F1-type ATP synthase membrane subunit c/vacuolar-type H+-ATPase subunit K